MEKLKEPIFEPTGNERKGYKTVGQMIFTKYPNCQRNKSGEYSKSLPRTDLTKN